MTLPIASTSVCCTPKKENGMALLVVLVILVLVGMVAVGGAQEAQLQARMSSNSQHYARASYRAETLLIRFERQLENHMKDGSWTLASFRDGHIAGLHDLSGGRASDFEPRNQTSWDSSAGASGAEGRFVIHYLGRVGPAPLNDVNARLDRRLHAFRLTVQVESRGAVAIVQSDIHLEVS
ncbi:hypothetical protein [Halomonas halocynthiae]|uniref:hypothetical protein n=1 Tax=Halomonas halocynthiae TaxID=176290 RepID=UPI0004269B52|nr:hypothetical protein [Halomonas halocynthiae]